MTIVDDYKAGKREFVGAYLQCAYLQGADLQNANLQGADLQNANLQGANLRYADLQYANLQGADLQNANLHGAYLQGADLQGANLQGAYLLQANLRDAHLLGTDLQDANLPPFQIPQGGELFVWKKLRGDVLAELIVPREARRTASLVGRKCRAEFVYVNALFRGVGWQLVLDQTCAVSNHDGKTSYTTGGWVYPDSYDDDIRTECSHGIHFFLTREEALAF